MTQEDKEFLIKDLCARLPYRVRILVTLEDLPTNTYASFDDDIVSIDCTNNTINDEYSIENIKPYLFPISSMTEEQKKEYFDICWKDWIDNKSKDIYETEVLYKGADWLNEHHFDYRGLIDKGLAIDSTNLNIY